MTPLIGELTRDLILEAMRAVTSADRAYRYLLDLGYEFTRSAIREAWKEVGYQDGWSTVLQTWGVERTPPKAWAIPGPKGMTSKYQMVVEMECYDIDNKRDVILYASVKSDKMIPFSKVIDEIEGTERYTPQKLGYIVKRMTPINVFVHPD